MHRLAVLLFFVFLTDGSPQLVDPKRDFNLRPSDAVRILESSELFRLHYARGGCPRAQADIGLESRDISVRMEDGCLGFVSSLVADYLVNRRTGEVRESNGRIVIAPTSLVVREVFNELESELLDEREASCLISSTSSLRELRRQGVSTREQHITDGDAFQLDVIPTAAKPVAPQQVFRFRVDRRYYKVFEGRFLKEDWSEGVLALASLISRAKQQVEFQARDILMAVRSIPEIQRWMKEDSCRDVRLDGDAEGVSYYSVELFRWCSGGRSESLGDVVVSKRSGKILVAHGIEIRSLILPGFIDRIKELEQQRSVARTRVESTCPASGR